MLLVTHQLQYLHNEKNVVIISSGKIEAKGSFAELKDSKTELLSFLPEENTAPEIDNEQPSSEKPSEEKEKQAEGTVDVTVYKRYFQSVGNFAIVAFVLTLLVICQAIASGIDYFVAQWVNWEESAIVKQQNEAIDDDRQYYVVFYSILMVSFVAIVFTSDFSFFYMCIRASQKLHDKIFNGVTKAFMSFFHKNSSGRILNRFSSDIGKIDTMLPSTIFECIRVNCEDKILSFHKFFSIVCFRIHWCYEFDGHRKVLVSYSNASHHWLILPDEKYLH